MTDIRDDWGLTQHTPLDQDTDKENHCDAQQNKAQSTITRRPDLFQ
jgi:hypothetical protein